MTILCLAFAAAALVVIVVALALAELPLVYVALGLWGMSAVLLTIQVAMSWRQRRTASSGRQGMEAVGGIPVSAQTGGLGKAPVGGTEQVYSASLAEPAVPAEVGEPRVAENRQWEVPSAQLPAWEIPATTGHDANTEVDPDADLADGGPEAPLDWSETTAALDALAASQPDAAMESYAGITWEDEPIRQVADTADPTDSELAEEAEEAEEADGDTDPEGAPATR